MFTKKQFFFTFIIAIIVVVAFAAYSFYKKTENQLSVTTAALQATQKTLVALESSTTVALQSENNLITTQADALKASQSSQTLLSDELQSFQNSQEAAERSSVTSVNQIAPSVVKLVCNADSKGDLEQGSGVLYSSGLAKEPYFVQTNLHVVTTADGSASACAIAVYPDYTNSSSYLVFQSNGFQEPIAGADVAFVAPELVDDPHAGTTAELAEYALSSASISFCQNQKVGDHLSVLGYPAIGGETLTVTDGIISGFDTEDGFQFITTSAKIDHGNSGGIAIEDSGCVLGIPTYIEADSTGSIGRILDLGNLFKSSTPQ